MYIISCLLINQNDLNSENWHNKNNISPSFLHKINFFMQFSFQKNIYECRLGQMMFMQYIQVTEKLY